MPQPTNSSLSRAPQPATKVSSGWFKRLFLLLVIVALGIVYIQRQAIADWIQLAGYVPPEDVAQIASQDDFTPLARHLFYLNSPQIEDKSSFAADCKSVEQSIVLGCYHSGEQGIFILKITGDPQLDGVMQVTAAHEMLHAAYERLSPSDKSVVDHQLMDFYNTGLKDQRVKDEINAYKKSEPGQVVNEMHSIFGTEVADLPSGLEQYYKRYLTNRGQVVKFAQNYQAAFTSRTTQVKQYDHQLAALKALIDANEATLTSQGGSLDSQRAEMDQLKSSGDYSAYNARVDGFNSQIRQYNALLQTVRDEIDQYNQLVQQRNNLVLQVQQLAQELSGDQLPSAQ